jgi:hypothetical protein
MERMGALRGVEGLGEGGGRRRHPLAERGGGRPGHRRPDLRRWLPGHAMNLLLSAYPRR